jgi:hypothetical protein
MLGGNLFQESGVLGRPREKRRVGIRWQVYRLQYSIWRGLGGPGGWPFDLDGLSPVAG